MKRRAPKDLKEETNPEDKEPKPKVYVDKENFQINISKSKGKNGEVCTLKVSQLENDLSLKLVITKKQREKS